MMNNIIVSSCLLGNNCKYNGGNNFKPELTLLSKKYHLIPFCPEVMGGLSTPRVPAEIRGKKVINQNQIDVTEAYLKGANLCLELAKKNNCQYAILKSKSPSCGFGLIYDGSFTKKAIKGNGITADLLYKNGIVILNENNYSQKL